MLGTPLPFLSEMVTRELAWNAQGSPDHWRSRCERAVSLSDSMEFRELLKACVRETPESVERFDQSVFCDDRTAA